MMTYDDNIPVDYSEHQVLAGVDDILAKRWSPRSFKKTPISDTDVDILFEAARWAPSCFNEQPWIFYVSNDNNFNDYLHLLQPDNQVWAQNASLLCFAICRQTFSLNGKDNQHAMFDTGAAWMSLTYQARAMGLYTHAMAGIDYDKIRQYLQLSGDQRVICAVAIGVIDQAELLPEHLVNKEKPKGRKPLSEIMQR